MRKRLKRSSGSAITPRDLLRISRRESREAASAADIVAIDRGEGRTVFCYYRGTYGSYPRRFAGCMLDLTPGSCQTSGGLLEFAVRRPDVDLVLHFFDRKAEQPRRPASPEDTAEQGV
jgi:hypothetical protein